MVVHRGRIAARLGAGLILAAACATGPLAVYAAAAPSGLVPMAGAGDCDNSSPSATAADVIVGQEVTVTGTCFEPYEYAAISIIGPDAQSSPPQQEKVDGNGTVSAEFEPTTPGEYTILISVGTTAQASGSFEVTPAATTEPEPTEEPSDQPTEDPTTPPSGEPTDDPTTDPAPDPTTDPAPEPTDDPTEDPTSAPAEPTDEQTTGSPTRTEEPTKDATTPPAEGSPSPTQKPRPSSSAPAPTVPFPSASKDPEPSAGGNTPQPVADGEPSAAEQRPDSPAPATPGPATNDFPADKPEYTQKQQKTAALAEMMTSLFAYGVSDGKVGALPAEAGSDGSSSADGSGSDAGGSSGESPSDGGGDELAETGSDSSAAAVAASIALLGGAGLLWHQRRRTG